MNTSADSRYSSPLRDGQKNATRDLILDAVGRCLENAGLDELNFAQVAAEAQISDRTIYRHFPTKELLLEAFWKTLHGNLGINSFPATAAELVDMPERVFLYFDRHEQVLRGMLASRQGREVRLSVNDERQQAIRRSVRDAVGEMAEPGFTHLCASIQLLYSATGWLTMKDYWGLSGEDAGRAASASIRSLLQNAAGDKKTTTKKTTANATRRKSK